jgi:hypothetical protein
MAEDLLVLLIPGTGVVGVASGRGEATVRAGRRVAGEVISVDEVVDPD